MPYSSRLPNDPKNPNKKREVEARKNAQAEQQKKSSITAEDKRGKEVELDPSRVEFFSAACPDHGLIGNYLREEDAHNAETMHQATAHGNTPGKRTLSVEAQRKRNKSSGK